MTPVLVLATATPAQAPTGTVLTTVAEQTHTTSSWHQHRQSPPAEADSALAGQDASER